MSTTDPFFRTVLVVEVLTEREAWNGDLGELSEDIVNGNASGDIKMRVVEQLLPAEAARLLIEQGSDPGFFGLGEDDEEDEEDDSVFDGTCSWCNAIIRTDTRQDETGSTRCDDTSEAHRNHIPAGLPQQED